MKVWPIPNTSLKDTIPSLKKENRMLKTMVASLEAKINTAEQCSRQIGLRNSVHVYEEPQLQNN